MLGSSTLNDWIPLSGRPNDYLRDGHVLDPEGSVVLELTNGETVSLSSEETCHFEAERTVALERPESVSPRKESAVAPTHVHLPVRAMTAAHNAEEKSESQARVRFPVTRYSVVINPSNHPDKYVRLNAPYLEVQY